MTTDAAVGRREDRPGAPTPSILRRAWEGRARIMAIVCWVNPVAIFTLMSGLAFSNGSMTAFLQPASNEPP